MNRRKFLKYLGLGAAAFFVPNIFKAKELPIGFKVNPNFTANESWFLSEPKLSYPEASEAMKRELKIVRGE